MKKVAIILVIALAFQSSACAFFTTKKAGDELKRDVRSLTDRLDKLDQTFEKDRVQLMETIDRARVEMEQLEETLTKATRILARNSADFGAEMDAIKDSVRKVEGTLAEIDHQVEESAGRVAAAEKRVIEFALAAGVDLPIDESKVPAGEKTHFAAIIKSFDDGRYGEARALAKIFLERYKKSRSSARSQLYIAQSYSFQKRWAKDLGALRRFTDDYPKSKYLAEVYYETARAFYMLGDCTDARILIDAITSKYKRSPFVKKANTLSSQLDKNKSRCTS